MVRKKKAGELAQPAQAAKPFSVHVAVTLEPSDATAVFYVNTADVGNTPHDFTLTFGRVPAKFTAADMQAIQASGKLVTDASVQLSVPPTLVPLLIKALEIQRGLYEGLWGPIKEIPINSPGVPEVKSVGVKNGH